MEIEVPAEVPAEKEVVTSPNTGLIRKEDAVSARTNEAAARGTAHPITRRLLCGLSPAATTILAVVVTAIVLASILGASLGTEMAKLKAR